MSLLTANQTAAVEKFAKLKVGAVFMKQGSGKTRVAVTLANANADKIQQVIVLTAVSTKSTMRDEFIKWGCQLPVHIVGYETLSSSDSTYMETLNLVKSKPTMMVADESIFVKNPEAIRTQRTNELRKYCSHVLLLNATPTTRDLWDLYHQMNLLSPKIIDMSPSEFQDAYFTRVNYKKPGMRYPKEFYKIYEPNVAHLMAKIEPFIYQADLKLPVKVWEEYETHSSSYDIGVAYADLRFEILIGYASYGGFDVIGQLQKLNRLANIDPMKNDAIAKKVIGTRTIVYTPWRDEQAMIASSCDGYIINGSTKHADRDRILAEFARNDKPLVMTYGVGSFGLNLQCSHQIEFASLTFDYAHIDHAKHRVQRLGQTKDIDITFHLSAHQISQTIWENIHRKNWLAELVRKQIDIEELI